MKLNFKKITTRNDRLTFLASKDLAKRVTPLSKAEWRDVCKIAVVNLRDFIKIKNVEVINHRHISSLRKTLKENYAWAGNQLIMYPYLFSFNLKWGLLDNVDKAFVQKLDLKSVTQDGAYMFMRKLNNTASMKDRNTLKAADPERSNEFKDNMDMLQKVKF